MKKKVKTIRTMQSRYNIKPYITSMYRLFYYKKMQKYKKLISNEDMTKADATKAKKKILKNLPPRRSTGSNERKLRTNKLYYNY